MAEKLYKHERIVQKDDNGRSGSKYHSSRTHLCLAMGDIPNRVRRAKQKQINSE